jgi:hypothetical protein
MEAQKPSCKLIGRDSNVYNIVGLVRDCLKYNGMRDEAEEFVMKASAAKSYDEVLQLAMKYVEVE